MKNKLISIMAVGVLSLSMLAGCGAKGTGSASNANGKIAAGTLVYGSHDYTRINPAIDEHGEINLLLFDGLTSHNKDGKVEPGLAKSWEIDQNSNTYTFHLRKGVKWHDGKEFTADDVKFTIDAIMNKKNESEIASNYAEIKKITVKDKYTVSFQLKEKNVAFLDYMTIGILPKHLLQGKNMQTDSFFKHPVGTGPYKLKEWTQGQSISLEKNDQYYKGEPKIANIVFKIVPDDSAKALQLKSGEINLAMVTPKDTQNFSSDKGYSVYKMKTADYRGIMYNFKNAFWKKNKNIIPGINYGIDREAMVKSVLLGEGITAYSPIQRNRFNDSSIEKFQYNPEKAKQIIEKAGWKLGKDGIYEKSGQKLSFTVNVMEGDQVRADLAAVASQQLKKIGVDCKAKIASKIDWEHQEAFLIGWGSPFDADDHTYKIFSTDQASNYNYYSDTKVDTALKKARQINNQAERKNYYSQFLKETVVNPPYTFFCYVDVNYVSGVKIKGITKNTILGHHGVGIFWNVKDWELEK